MKIICQAQIPNEIERKAFMSWVRQVANAGYSEIGTTVTLTYKWEPNDPASEERRWGITRVFETVEEHAIQVL